MTQPACMTDAEYVLWSEANQRTPVHIGSPCFDCPLSFAIEMREADCCNGVPGGLQGRPRLTQRLVAYRGRGSKYPTEEDRIAAHRQQWRDAYQRKKARA